MLTVDGINLAINYGEDGIIVVDTGPVGSSERVLEAIRAVSSAPIRYIVNTSTDKDRTGGNEGIANAGKSFTSGPAGEATPIIAHKNALLRMLAEPGQNYAALPSGIFTRKFRNFNLNGQAIQVIWEPRAHTDGDVIVFMRESDVVVTGAIYDPTRFPIIDIEHGGSIQGEIDALNEILNGMTVGATPLTEKPGETLIIPARGPLSKKMISLTTVTWSPSFAIASKMGSSASRRLSRYKPQTRCRVSVPDMPSHRSRHASSSSLSIRAS
jgi:glyoxylase-like metal-dependent hydrolase (beta-lactamase superfamily II)